MDGREGQERWSRDTDKRRVGKGNWEGKKNRIVKLKWVLEGNLMHVISAYAPQEGKTQEEKEEFEELWVTALAIFMKMKY